MSKLHRFLPVVWGLAATMSAYAQQKPTVASYDFGDRAYISMITGNGKWALTGATAESSAPIRLIDLTTGNASTFPSGSTSLSVSDDGKRVAGAYKSAAAISDVASMKWENLEVPAKFTISEASHITPDGRYAVGMGWVSGDRIDGCEGLMWDLSTKKLISLPNLPKRSGLNSPITGYKFTGISDDGRYILGEVDWDIMLTSDAGLFLKYLFVYDRQTETWNAVGYDLQVDESHSNTEAYVEVENGYMLTDTGVDLGPWYKFVPQMDMLYFVDGGHMSHNGKYVGGTGWFDDGVDSYEYPLLYNVVDKTSVSYPDASGAMAAEVTDDGVLIAATPTSTPVRETMVRGDGYWFPLSTILMQKYGYNFYESTGYDNTGTANGVTVDAKRIALMPDPDTSYILDLPESLRELTSNIQLLGMYMTNVPVDATMSQVKDVTITFNYDIESLTTSSGAQILNSDGSVKANSNAVIAEGRDLRISFRRNNTLDDNASYEVVLPAGAICIKGDKAQLNPEIRIPVKGRADKPVAATDIYPADNAQTHVLDYSTNPLIITFDCQIKKDDTVSSPALFREGESTAFCALNSMVNGKQLWIYPPTSQNLFKGQEYRVEIPAGIVTDLSGNGASEAITLHYTGIYEHEIPSDIDRLFYDDFSSGVKNFLLYDGDHLTPNSEMQGWQFTSELPWSLVMEDDYSNYAAASHSMYSPAGQSDDWMVIPRLYIQDKNCRLHFKAQSYDSKKTDVLKVLVWASDDNYQTLNAATVAKIKEEGVEMLSETLVPQQRKGTMEGSWKDYSVPLEQFMGKNVYIAFWNNNDRQSAIFLDDVEVTRGLDFFLSLDDTPKSVIDKQSVDVKCFVAGNSTDKTYDKLTATLYDSADNKISEYTASGLNLKKGDRHEFTFPQPLPVSLGEPNSYKVVAQLDDDRLETTATVNNLAFNPTKRVVLEEYTGMGCGNCPRGILAIEHMEQRFGSSFIPVGIHTYPGDYLSQHLSAYSTFLGLAAAPSGQINRSYGDVSPMLVGSDNAYFSLADYVATGGSSEGLEPVWEDYVAEELAVPTEADIKATADYDKEANAFKVNAEVKYAMKATGRNLNLFAVLLEDDVKGDQSNYLASDAFAVYGDWGKGGRYGTPVVFDYNYRDVARAVLGVTYNGTGGLLPTEFEAGRSYTAEMGSLKVPDMVSDPDKCRVVVMLIDATSGKIINAHIANTDDIPGGVDDILADDASSGPALSLTGRTLQVNGTGSVNVSVYSTDGCRLAGKTISGSSSMELKGYSGVIIVKASDSNGCTTLKAILR